MSNSGGGLSRNGYYCCSTASAIDRVMGFNLGLKTINASDRDFRKQTNVLCRYCGFFYIAITKTNLVFRPNPGKKLWQTTKRKNPFSINTRM